MDAIKSWLQDTLAALKKNIDKLVSARAEKLKTLPPPALAIANANATKDDKDYKGTVMAAQGDENPAPLFTSSSDAANGTTAPQGDNKSDPWTSITCSFSAKDQQTNFTASSWGMSVGGGGGWGLWSVGGSYSHESSSSYVSFLVEPHVFHLLTCWQRLLQRHGRLRRENELLCLGSQY